ncbi:MAG: PIN domain-containing protein [Terriglobia bacterium]
MICADTSSVVAYIRGEHGSDIDLLDRALADYSLVLAQVSVSELLSDPDLTPSVEKFVLGLEQLEITPGYWQRAGHLRAGLFRRGYRPKISDTLIAQSCLDHRVPLITRDRDFSCFQKFAGLQLLVMGDLLP